MRKIVPRIIVPQIIAPWMIVPRTIAPNDNCPQRKLHLGQLSLRIIAPENKCSPENCPLTIRFRPKIIAPTQVNSPKRVLFHSTKSYFSRLQLKSKKWFTSIYFLQILTKPYRTPLKRENLSLNASWFFYTKTQKKIQFFGKIDSEKNTKKLHSK